MNLRIADAGALVEFIHRTVSTSEEGPADGADGEVFEWPGSFVRIDRPGANRVRRYADLEPAKEAGVADRSGSGRRWRCCGRRMDSWTGGYLVHLAPLGRGLEVACLRT